jgi:Protein of unknown function (DUF3822)
MTTVYQAMKRLAIIDESLQTTPPENCCLYVQIALPFVSYCLFDRIRNKYIALCEYRLPDDNTAEELTVLLHQDEILSVKGFYKTGVSVISQKFVLVPASIYNVKDAAQLLATTSTLSDDETLCADPLKYTDVVNIYSIPSSLASLIDECFPGSSIVHSGTILMESELLRNKNNTEPSIAVNVRQGSYDICITTGNQLNYFNTFQNHSSEDFIYYLLFVMEQMKLNPEKTPVHFSGDIETKMASYLITAKYIRNILFENRPDAFEYSYGFNQTSSHSHATLLNHYLCAS